MKPMSGTMVRMLNKVPEVTLYFWVIKIMATTVGETAADFLSVTMNLGTLSTDLIMSALLAIALAAQIRLRKYVPSIYWIAVVLISVVGTLVTDTLVDKLGVSLQTTTVVFSLALIGTFVAWYASEKTLSIRTIVSTRRELFYWTAVLFTFALGTAAGDLMAESFALGYATAGLIFGAMIGAAALAHYAFGANSVLTFWIAYILTRPLGASFGDLLSQPLANGGLGLGTAVTSQAFLAVILALVAFLSVTRRDAVAIDDEAHNLK
ncbi:MAG: COG4705 family protein [Burkholderiales bacterium]